MPPKGNVSTASTAGAHYANLTQEKRGECIPELIHMRYPLRCPRGARIVIARHILPTGLGKASKACDVILPIMPDR